MTDHTHPFAQIELFDNGTYASFEFAGRTLFKGWPATVSSSVYPWLMALAFAIYAVRALWLGPASPGERPSRLVFWSVVGLAFVSHAALLDAVIEDLYISMRYVDHALSGGGLVWNLGEPPIEGFSNLLFTLLTVVAGFLGAAPPVAARLLSLAFGLVALVLMGRLVWRWTGDRRAAELVVLLAAGQPTLAGYAGSGLETTLFASLLLGVWVALEDERPVWASLLAGLAWTARPDGAVIGAVLGALGLVRAYRSGRWQELARLAGPFALIACAVTLGRYAYFGDLVPNSARAKSVIDAHSVQFGLAYTKGYFARELGFVEATVACVFCLAGARLPRMKRPSVLITALLMAAATVAVGGDWMPGYRYHYPLILVSFLIAGDGLGQVLAASARPKVVVLACLVMAAPLSWHRALATDALATEFHLLEHSLNDLAVLGSELERHDVGAPLAAVAAGILAYTYPGPIVDICGLNDRVIARAPVVQFTFPGHSRCNPALALKRRPALVTLHGAEFMREPSYIPSYRDEGYEPLTLHFNRAVSPGYAVLWARADIAPEIARALARAPPVNR